jgi:hypothetical protein
MENAIMFRAVTCASLLVMFVATAVQAQITSSPVVTSWPAEVRVVNFPPAVTPVAACNSCAPGPVMVASPVIAAPVTTYYAPTVSYAVPVVTYAQPTTAWRWPFTARYRPAVTYVVPPVYAPTVAYYNPITTYRMPTPPAVSFTSVPVAPTTTYYAPTLASPVVTGPAIMPAPAPISSGCGCSGR